MKILPKATISKRVLDSNKSDVSALILLAAIWPAVAGALSVFLLSTKRARIVLLCIMVLIGYRIVLDDHRYDAYRLGEYVTEIASYNATEFFRWVDQYCFNTEQCIDPGLPIVTFILTRINDSTAFGFGVYSFLFSLFSIGYLSGIRGKFNSTDLAFSYVFLIAIALTNPIQNVGGFRFNTASWMFLFGLFNIFFRRRDSGFAFIFLAVAFHYSMFLIAIIVIAVRFLNIPTRWALALAVLSLFIVLPSGLIAPIFSDSLDVGAVARASRYTSDASLAAYDLDIAQASSSNLFFSLYAFDGVKFVIGACMMFLIFSDRLALIETYGQKFIVLFCLIFAISNFFLSIPTFSRYIVISVQIFYTVLIVQSYIFDRFEKRILLIVFIHTIFVSIL
jgi:hypothetical protein